MLEHVVEGGDALEKNVVKNVQNESHAMDKSSIKRKRNGPTMSRDICWELATKAQLMVDTKSFSDQKENIDDQSACEGGEQQH